MMNNDNYTHTMECKCLSWKPIIAGALVAVGFSFLLNLFSVAIGLTAFSTNSEGVETMVLGGFLGAGIGVIVSMFAAGWLSGYLGQRYCTKAHIGALYGFLTWCVALLIAVLISSHFQDYVTMYNHTLSGMTDMVASSPASNTAVAVTAQTKSLAISAYIIFAMFFLSAFACALGGHCGMRHISNKTQG